MLQSAHQGYYYQDLLGAYCIANEIAQGRIDTEFSFDKKQSAKDLFDDLSILRNGKVYKYQIKYSNPTSNHIFCKQDLSNGSTYGIGLSDLYFSWKEGKSVEELRILLAWQKPEPSDELNKILIPRDTENLFGSDHQVYQVNADVLWPLEGKPLSSWRKFNMAMKMENRADFIRFCNQLFIEVGLPKASFELNNPAPAEQVLLQCIDDIGIGIYPNNHISQKMTATMLIDLVRLQRMNSQTAIWLISAKDAAHKTNIILNYGSIEQDFPIDTEHIVETHDSVKIIKETFRTCNKVILKGEPGAGKSWLIENLEKASPESKLIKHYCYTTLDDTKQASRIQVNSFYGSLIDQITAEFKDIDDSMSRRFAADSIGLNELINNIKEPTIIVLDGLDHIWRVYHVNKSSLTQEETGILESVKSLVIANPQVKLIVLSQPIVQLNELDDFKLITIVPWSYNEVDALLKTYLINFDSDRQKEDLIAAILSKSNGNALYTSYIIKSLHQAKLLDVSYVASLPDYDFNLEEYYSYLIRQISEEKDVPLAFCGASFSLSENDLIEITNLGTYVKEDLEILSPILNYSVAHSGYKIYHESFKRFMIGTVEINLVSLIKKVYDPIKTWLAGKDFFEFRKSALYYFSLAELTDTLPDILSYISPTFIQNALFHGHPIEIINKNHKLLAKALKTSRDYNHIVILAEQSKILRELGAFNYYACDEYFKTLSDLYGMQAMYDSIYNEGKLLVQEEEAYRLLKEALYRGNQVNWNIIPKKQTISKIGFEATVAKNLSDKNYNKIEDYVTQFKDDQEWLSVLIEEVNNWILHSGDRNWVNDLPNFKRIYLSANKISNRKSLPTLLNDLRNISEKYEGKGRIEIIDKIRHRVKKLVQENKSNSIQKSTEVLRNINWFYNWVIYVIEIAKLENTHSISDSDIVEAFDILLLDTSPYKGEPSTRDLHQIEEYIRSTFRAGLRLIKNSNNRDKCISILKKLSNETTYSIQRDYGGILTTEELSDISNEFLSPSKLIQIQIENIDRAKSHRTHNDLARMTFRLSSLYVRNGNDDLARSTFRKGIELLTSYGIRKDYTLSELTESCTPYFKYIPDDSQDTMEELYRMALSVVFHTDGKGTNHYPISWYKEYFQLFPNRAIAFLASEILGTDKPHYYEEEELIYSIQHSTTEANSLLEFALLKTIPNGASSSFFKAVLKVLKSCNENEISIVQPWVSRMAQNAGIDSYEKEYSKDLVDGLSKYLDPKLIANFKIKPERSDSMKRSAGKIEFKPTSFKDAISLIHHTKLESFRPTSIEKYLDSLESFNEWAQCTKLIYLHSYYVSEYFQWLDEKYVLNSDRWVFVNVARFVYRHTGWFHALEDSTLFEEAYAVAPDKSTEYLFEFLSSMLDHDHYPQQISANLIKTLVILKYDKTEVKRIWTSVFNIIRTRIPFVDPYDFHKEVDPFLENLTHEELLSCVLLSRIKGMTIERVQQQVHGLVMMAERSPDLLMRPIVWVLRNAMHLSPLHLSIILQIVLTSKLRFNLSEEFGGCLQKIYPTGYFINDFLIEQLVGLHPSIDGLFEARNPVSASERDMSYLLLRHYRYQFLNDLGFDLSYVASSIEEIMLEDESQDLLQHYFSRMYDCTVHITKHAEHLFELLQKELYTPFRHFLSKGNFFLVPDLLLSIPEITLQIGSRTNRPENLPLPSTLDKSEYRFDDLECPQDNWRRIATYEVERYSDESSKPKFIQFFQGLLFGKSDKKKSVAWSKYRFFTTLQQQIQYSLYDYDIEATPIICSLDSDFFERTNILWLSPYICQEFSIQIRKPYYRGLVGINEDQEEVLRFSSWQEGYNGSSNGSDEFADLHGAQLCIREDYYQKMLDLYQVKSGKMVSTILSQ